jgi:DNA-binding CsgD family transcriptional regulator
MAKRRSPIGNGRGTRAPAGKASVVVSSTATTKASGNGGRAVPGYGLTPAQADVARNLYAGLSVERTAAELDLSPNTVRSNLKQIFSKCDVQSQAELMHTFAVGPHSF